MKILQSPQKYIQGADAVKHLGEYCLLLGKSPLIIIDKSIKSIVLSSIEDSFKEQQLTLNLIDFNGECCNKEVDRIVAEASNKYDVIVGVGGGKCMDTAKLVADKMDNRVIIFPTIASTDAPCSALSVLYTENGEFEKYVTFKRNPDIVLIDSRIIANAPSRFLVSGMGDGLSTFYEAEICYRSQRISIAGGTSTITALEIARLCKDIIYKYGRIAKLSCDKNILNEAVEAIIEANSYLSGIGFESSGLGAAHPIHNGLTQIEECHHFFHGEKVAFSIIPHLILDNNYDEAKRVVEFNKSVGLPSKLADLGIKTDIENKVRLVAKGSCAEGESIHNFPYEITEEMVYNAIMTADFLGQ